MKIGIKLLVCAVLSLSIGIASAYPLLVSELNIRPFFRVPEGPKAGFSIDTVYANFNVQMHASNQSSGGLNLSIVDYQVVFNVTNLSDFPARMASVNLVVAEEVAFVPSIVGGFSIGSGGGKSGSGGNGFVEGLWLDDEWLNVTWLPDGDWPMFPSGPNNNITTIIPDLPVNATYEGQWIEGVHVWENRNITTTSSGTTITTATYIFANGTWVDVTDRVRPGQEVPFVRASNTLVSERRLFATEYYGNYRNANEFAEAMSNRTTSQFMHFGPTYTWAGEGGFNITWAPHESRLIMLSGTREVGVNWGLESLAEGKIMLYGAASNYLKDIKEMNGAYVNTFSTVTTLKQIAVEKTPDGYLYNAVLGEDQMFISDQWGVEVSIKPRS